jgi:cell wall-associated NlpC family hydrolase
MLSLEQLSDLDKGEYCCRSHLDLYEAVKGDRLATQAAAGRHLKILSVSPVKDFVEVYLCEDGYTAWLPIDKLTELEPTQITYQAIAFSRTQIESCLPDIIAFTKAAMTVPNYYLWGGTVAPNYDCSGLMQAAFANRGIWLPRDSYQQEAFTQKIVREELLPGDLIFFGTEKVNHVALYLGDGYYIHSSGQEMGRNGIAIDPLSEAGDEISRSYYQKLWSFGRVTASYQPQSGKKENN